MSDETEAPCEHHFVPVRAGKVGGEPAFVQKCRYCGKTLAQVEAEEAR